jgi:hypothetical protein
MAVGAFLAPLGCSLGGDEEPKPVTGVPKEIAATVDRLERAVAGRDYETICNQLFTAQARKRAGGDECVSQMSSAAEDVRRPSIRIKRIEVNADNATVEVVTQAEGQARVTDSLDLRRSEGAWLIDALR